MWFTCYVVSCIVLTSNHYLERHWRIGVYRRSGIKRDLCKLMNAWRVEYPNGGLITRMHDLSPVCAEPTLRERQLISPSRIRDMTRAAVTPETGRMHRRGGGRRSSCWALGWLWMKYAWLIMGEWFHWWSFELCFWPNRLTCIVLRDWMVRVSNYHSTAGWTMKLHQRVAAVQIEYSFVLSSIPPLCL